MAGPEFQQLPAAGLNVGVGAELQQQLTSAQLQSLRLLQTPSVLLSRELETAVERNPLLELRQPEFGQGETKIDNGDSDDWRLGNEVRGNGVSREEAQRRRDYFFNSIEDKDSVYEKLERQIEWTAADDKTRALLNAIYNHLDGRGFLDLPAETLRETLHADKKTFSEALKLFRTFEPAGVASENLREFYLFQFKNAGYKKNDVIVRLVRDCFDDLLAGRIVQLTEKLGVPREQIDEALALIAKFPRRAIESDVPAAVVEPDLSFYKDEKTGTWAVRLLRERQPSLRISREYKQMLAQGKITGADKVYFEQKLHEAKQLISALEERGNTLEAVGNLILELQKDFFENGPTALRPLIMADLAKRLSVHPTTVTRAVAEKYAETPFGIWKLRNFFSNEAGSAVESGAGSNLSQVAIKNMIKALIEEEPRGDPFSDEKLVGLLGEKGVKIARRTVVKYREALGIPSTRVRRNL